jgi:hypothetical protein
LYELEALRDALGEELEALDECALNERERPTRAEDSNTVMYRFSPGPTRDRRHVSGAF